MKRISILLLLIFTLSSVNINATTLPCDVRITLPSNTSISQFWYEPNIRYDHRTVIKDRFVDGFFCYAKWYTGINIYGNRYFYFLWRAY